VLGLAALVAVVGGVAVVSLSGGGPRTGLEVGDRVPDYGAPALSGAEQSLADHRGEVVLVNIWATWCGPCRIEMPSIQALYDRYGSDGFTVLAVSIDAGPGHRDKVEGFVSEHGLTFPVLLDPGSRITGLFRTSGVPETFVLDRHGRIVKRVIGASDWDSEANRVLIEELLAVEG
jgi:peroxiredoxin